MNSCRHDESLHLYCELIFLEKAIIGNAPSQSGSIDQYTPNFFRQFNKKRGLESLRSLHYLQPNFQVVLGLSSLAADLTRDLLDGDLGLVLMHRLNDKLGWMPNRGQPQMPLLHQLLLQSDKDIHEAHFHAV